MTDCVHNLVNGGTFYVCTKCNGDFDDLGEPVGPKPVAARCRHQDAIGLPDCPVCNPAAKPAACAKPPAGWSCSRTPGHEGPCAASPVPALHHAGGDWVSGDGPLHAPGCALLWVPPGARCTCPGPDGKKPPLGREPDLTPPPRLRIKTDGTPEGTTIEANGVDLGNVCYGFSVDFDVSRRPVVTLRCYEIDLELTERHGDPDGNVNFYKACANCEGGLNVPPAAGPPSFIRDWLQQQLTEQPTSGTFVNRGRRQAFEEALAFVNGISAPPPVVPPAVPCPSGSDQDGGHCATCGHGHK